MNIIDLHQQAQGLTQAWTSSVMADLGNARLKVLRMDGRSHPEEQHDHAEVLLVLDGELQLSLEGQHHRMHSGQMVTVPTGVAHAVLPGSHGCLLIFS